MENTNVASGQKPLKLNYRRTCIIGFAFFGILLLWQIYNMTCPTFLTQLLANSIVPGYGDMTKGSAEYVEATLQVQYIVGIIMAMDNIAALIMLPIFGRISDKTKTPIGKRMPFILVGTIISAIAVPFIPLAFHYGNVAGLISTMAVVVFFMMMYRSPAVSLMPDMTPKPLRAKANGIINVMGYLGGGVGSIFLTINAFKLTTYLNDPNKNIWTIEVPYLVVSAMMIISVIVLFVLIKENKIEKEVEPDMERGEQEAAIVDQYKSEEDDAPLSKANKRMLFLILGAEVLWFMGMNAVETYMGNYVIYYLGCESGSTAWITIVGGACSVVGFLVAGPLSEKIGRKYTIISGLLLTVIGYFIMCFISPSTSTVTTSSGVVYNKFPWVFYLIWAINGFGGSLIHTCSFPMVVELCTKKKIGQFTGYYYSASMLAQSVTPIILGLIFKAAVGGLGGEAWKALPIYACAMLAGAVIVFMFVKNVKITKVNTKKGLEALGDDD